MSALRLPSLAIFRHGLYTQFILGRWFATLAVQMQLTAMGWQVYDAARAEGQTIPQASFVLGMVGLAQFLPLLVLSLFGGQAADRYNRKVILTACLAAKALIAAGLTIVSLNQTPLIIPTVLTAAACAGAINAFLPPAASAFMPMLLPREELPQGIAWNSLAFQSGTIVGPAIGGLLYAFGPAAAYGGAFALLAAGAFLMARMRAPRQPPVADARTIGLIVEGLRYVWSNRIVLGAISLDLIVVLLGGAVALLPVFARDILHVGPSELGVLRAAMGAGAAVVALWIAAAPLRRNVGRWMFGATIVFGLATIAFGISTNIWVTVAALAAAGGADMISVYVRQSLIQLATPDEMRGRVSAVSFVFISASNELGDFESGVVARFLGPVTAVIVGGALAVGASTLWMRLFPRLRRADGFDTLPSPATQAQIMQEAVAEPRPAIDAQ
ncbi:MAG: MFS transporter [Proteobacteria bacterium]|nr:MFS transporter [Pseudomonadota bacterium]